MSRRRPSSGPTARSERFATGNDSGPGSSERRSDSLSIGSAAKGGAEGTVEDDVARGELRARVAEAVAGLPEKPRLVTVLVAIEEQDLASVARLPELAEGTVKSRLHRARKELAEKLRWLVTDRAVRQVA